MAKIDLGKYFAPKVIVNLSVLFGFLVFIVMILSFLGKEIKDKAQQIQDQRTEIGSRINSISKLADLSATAKEVQPALDELNSLLPKRDELVIFPRYINTLATESGVDEHFSFNGGEVSPAGAEAGYSAFTLSITGPYANVMAFLEELEKGNFVIRVEGLDVTIQTGSASFKADIQGLIFFRD